MCNVEAVQFLIDAGAPLDVRNRYGNTLIEWTHKIIEMIPRPEQRLRPAVRERMLRRAAEVLRLLEAAGAQ